VPIFNKPKNLNSPRIFQNVSYILNILSVINYATFRFINQFKGYLRQCGEVFQQGRLPKNKIF
jgi:hypothetical protein